MGRTKERNAKIELIRIVACFLVIAQHILIVPTDGNGVLHTGTVTLIALAYMDVPLFLLISGFLMFQNMEDGRIENLWPNYKHKLKNLLVYVFIPSCIIVLVSGVVGPYLEGSVTLEQLLAEKNPHLEWTYFYIFAQKTYSIYGIFWYIWTYTKVVICFPLLAFICQDVKDKNCVRRFLMILSWLNVLFTDIQVATGKGIGDFNNLTLDRYFLYVLLGYEIYLFVRKTENQKVRIWGAILFITGIIIGVVVEHSSYYRLGLRIMPVVFTMAASVGFFMLLYSLKLPEHSKVLNYMGKATLYIYMVHIIVLFSCKKIWGDFFISLFHNGSNVWWLSLYAIVYGTIIFALSLAVGSVFKFVYEKLIVRPIELVGKKFAKMIMKWKE